MTTTILSVFISIFIAGALIFLVLLRFLPRGLPLTRLLALAIVFGVFWLVFKLPDNWLWYILLVIGLLCFAALVVYLLALSGSGLVYQNTQTTYKPEYDDPLLKELFDAFHKGKVAKWKSLLQSHPGYLQNKQLLKDVLYDAAMEGKSNKRKLAALTYMLDSGAKIDSSLCHDFSQFAYTGKLDFTELLLQHGADPNCNIEPSKPLFYIISGYQNSGKIVELLVKYGADPNAKVYYEQFKEELTPLLFATYLGVWQGCIDLLENGADPDFKNKDGVSIKDYVRLKAENPEDHLYYKDPVFLQYVERIEQH